MLRFQRPSQQFFSHVGTEQTLPWYTSTFGDNLVWVGCNPCQILVHAHTVHVHVMHDDSGGAVQTGLHLVTGKFFVDRGS